MALPFKRPGGNKFTGVITDYSFETKSGTTARGEWRNHTVVLNIQKDGAEKPVVKFFPAGLLWGDNEVSVDKKTIIGSDRYTLDGETEWGQFILSLIEGEGNRLPEAHLEAEQFRSYNALVGVRLEFEVKVDREATIAAGKRKLGVKANGASEEEIVAAGKRKDKNDKSKSYMLDKTLVSEVLALPEAKGKGKAAAAAKKAGASGAAKSTTAAQSAAVDTDAADAALKAVLGAAANQTLPRTSISSSFIRYALAQKIEGEAREAIRKMLISDDYINGASERGIVVVDGEGKAAALVLAA